MTRYRDISSDKRKTSEILKKKNLIVKTEKSWLDHTKKGAIIDFELIKGSSLENLVKKSGRKKNSVEAHIYHLRKEHGINISYKNGIYKIMNSETKKI